MQDEHKRRASDLSGGAPPTGEPLLMLLREVLGRLEDLERSRNEIGSAFVRNDLSKADFDGHRRAHLELIKTAALMDGYKHKATETVMTWVVRGALALILAGLIAWSGGHIK